MKRIYPIICFSILYTIATAQQWNSYTPFAWFDINAVDITQPGHIVLGGGREANDSVQIMFTSPDYGLNWYENEHDGLAAWNKSIAFSDTSNGLGVGNWGRIISTGDGGAHWGNAVYPIVRNFNKIVNVTPQIYYAVGGKKSNDSMQTIIKTTDGGTNWNVIYDTAGTWLKSVYFIDTLKGFVVGDSGVILATTNGGSSWSIITPPVQRDFNAITFINADTGFIAGGSQGHRTILRTDNGGTAWSIISDIPGGKLNDISFADDTTGYMVGDSALVLKTTDGGQTWAPVQISNTLTGQEEFRAVKFYDKSFGAIAGKSGVLYVYTNTPQPDVFTTGSGPVDSVQATLHALVNTHGFPVIYSFYYSVDSNLIGALGTGGQNINSNSLSSITQQISGLTPNTNYYYCVAIQTVSGMVYGDTLRFFTGTSSYVFNTDSAEGVTDTSATLYGRINKFPLPVNLYFDYDTTPAFNHSVATTPALIIDTLQHTVSATLDSLLPDKNYYYQLRGVTSSNVSYYGDIHAFRTHTPFQNFQTLAPTNVTDSSAGLNGLVWKPKFPTTLSFEYGNTIAFGNEVTAIPASVNDTLQHAVQATLSSLMPDTTYYYRLKGVTASGTYYGSTQVFYTGTLYTVLETQPAFVFLDTTVTFRGIINGFRVPAMVSFEYSTTLPMQQQTSSGFYNDTLLYTVWGNANGLSRNALYYFRIKAETALGTFYGNILTFYTGNANIGFQTLQATAVNQTSAQLNGQAAKLSFTTALSFEYGTTTSLGNVIVANPANVNDTLQHHVMASLSGLVPNTVYYYRLEGSTQGNINFSGGMKQLYTADCEIPNCDFEVWDTTTLEVPTGWNVQGEVHRVPSYNGTNAVEFRGGSMSHLGAIILGIPKGPTPSGYPFPARPDSVMFYARYNIMPGDTGYVALFFSRHDTLINQEIFPITGNSGGNFVLKKYKINFPTSDVPDTIGMVFLSANGFSADPPASSNPNSILAIDDISFAGTNVNVPNHDFEQWGTSAFDNPQGWHSLPDFEFIPTTIFDPIVKTTDKVSGNYAVQLQNNPAQTTKTTYIQTGVHESYSVPTFPVGARHATLNGYLKYLPQNGDTLNISVSMYKNGIPIGNSMVNIDTAITSYTPFSFDIGYAPNNTDIPDSADISVTIGNFNPHGNSVAYIDNLSFDGFRPTTGIINNYLSDISCQVYPNPAANNLNVDLYGFSGEVVYAVEDILGKNVFSITDYIDHMGRIIKNLNISQLPSGAYLLQVRSEKGSVTRKFIVGE